MVADRWAFMAPWWRILQAHDATLTLGRCGLREELRGLKVSVYPRPPSHRGPVFYADPGQESTQTPQLRDALELALLQAIVDRPAFEQEILRIHERVRFNHHQDMAAVFEAHPDDSLTHVELYVNIIKSPQVKLDPAHVALSVFLTRQRLEDRDPAFQEARRQVLMQIPLHEHAERAACETIKIYVHLYSGQETTEDRSLLEPMRLVGTTEAASVSNEAAYPFVAGPFNLSFQLSPITPEITTKIDALHARGATTPFAGVTIPSTAAWSRLDLGKALAAVFPTESSAQVGRTITRYSTVSFGEQGQSEHFAQVCSAIMHSHGIPSLSISKGQRLVWSPSMRSRGPWTIVSRRCDLRLLMFTLFSRWATHRIEEVDFGCILFSDTDAEDINQLMLCENPLPAIFDGSPFAAYGSTRATQVLVKKNATVKLSRKKNKATGERPSITILEYTWFDVIGREPYDWCVFVPAYGKCLLRCCDVVRERATPVAGSFGSQGIKSLRFKAPSIRMETRCAMFSILRSFGPQIEALAVQDTKIEHVDALMTLLAACPSLKRLQLRGTTSDLLPRLVQAYERGICTATSLDIRRMSDQFVPEMQQIYGILTDPTRCVTKTIRELLVSVQNPEGSMDSECAAIRTMLETNTVLEYLERTCSIARNIAIPIGSLIHNIRPRTVPRIQQHHNRG